MTVPVLLPDPTRFHVRYLDVSGTLITVGVATICTAALCPLCQHPVFAHPFALCTAPG